MSLGIGGTLAGVSAHGHRAWEEAVATSRAALRQGISDLLVTFAPQVLRSEHRARIVDTTVDLVLVRIVESMRAAALVGHSASEATPLEREVLEAALSYADVSLALPEGARPRVSIEGAAFGDDGPGPVPFVVALSELMEKAHEYGDLVRDRVGVPGPEHKPEPPANVVPFGRRKR